MIKKGFFRPYPGHKVFELDRMTAEIRECEVKVVDGKKRIEEKKDHLYVSALNKENAKKKFSNLIAYQLWMEKQAQQNKA